jgi:hypothetical protein
LSPVEISASAVSLTTDSLILFPNVFHEFQPMGGVEAIKFDEGNTVSPKVVKG